VRARASAELASRSAWSDWLDQRRK
jgi:hypothetical protein